jgi:hypothetical protein
VNPTLLALATRLHTALLDPLPRAPDRTRPADPTHPAAARMHGDGGQATTEYALVLLAAALVALLVVGWATAGGGAAKVGRLFDRVIDSVIDKV